MLSLLFNFHSQIRLLKITELLTVSIIIILLLCAPTFGSYSGVTVQGMAECGSRHSILRKIIR